MRRIGFRLSAVPIRSNEPPIHFYPIMHPTQKRLHGILIVAATVVIVTGGGLLLLRRHQSAEIPGRYVYDLGTVAVGDGCRHEFEISNPLDRSVHVRAVRAECSCTVVGSTPTDIPPRGHILVPVQLKPFAAKERFTSSVWMRLDDGSVIELVLLARVIEQYPDVVELGVVRRGGATARTFYLHSMTPQAIPVPEFEYDHNRLRVAANPAQDGSVKVELCVANSCPYGEFRSSMTFALPPGMSAKSSVVQERRRLGEITVKGYVERPVEVKPRNLAVRIPADRSEAVEWLEFYSPYNRPFEIRGFEAMPSSGLTWNLKDVRREGGSVFIPVHVVLPTGKSAFHWRVKVSAESDGGLMDTGMDVYALRE